MTVDAEALNELLDRYAVEHRRLHGHWPIVMHQEKYRHMRERVAITDANVYGDPKTADVTIQSCLGDIACVEFGGLSWEFGAVYSQRMRETGLSFEQITDECRAKDDFSEPPPAAGSCYYFGCIREAGHFLWSESGRRVHDVLPFSEHILDAGLLPPCERQIEGSGALVHFATHTVFTFWDRSIDKRGRSNSAFIIPGFRTFDELAKIAKQRFPLIWERLTFNLECR